MLWLGERASLICNFFLSVATRTIVEADPYQRYTFHGASTKWNNILPLLEDWLSLRLLFRPLTRSLLQFVLTHPRPLQQRYQGSPTLNILLFGQREPLVPTSDSSWKMPSCLQFWGFWRPGNSFLACYWLTGKKKKECGGESKDRQGIEREERRHEGNKEEKTHNERKYERTDWLLILTLSRSKERDEPEGTVRLSDHWFLTPCQPLQSPYGNENCLGRENREQRGNRQYNGVHSSGFLGIIRHGQLRLRRTWKTSKEV